MMTSSCLTFDPGTPLVSQAPRPIFHRLAATLPFDIPLSFVCKAEWQENPERYSVHLDEDGVVIGSATDAGCFFGLQELLAHIREKGLQALDIQAEPAVPERGLKLYLPSPEPSGMEEFKRIVDFASECKCNFIMLELGGALEYRSHPEINEGWIEYARCMNEFPGKTLKVQEQFPWRKNSIHTENGGGKVISQEQFVELVSYCRERFLEVIPEMPSLSHSDYLLMRHRDFSERPEDPFPDTCCPLHEGWHRLYQDLLDEVIDLIHPERLNIGHDEYYTMGKCPRCRGKNFPELYAHDIDRIAAYLRHKGVKTMIFGEKLLDSHWLNGIPIGGAEVPESENMEALPAIWPAIDLLKEKVEVFHWYWTVNRALDEEYGKRGMDYCFANVSPAQFKDWNRRMQAPHARGICVSNWGQTSLRTLQRNGVLYDLAYSAELLWNRDITPDDYEKINRRVFAKLYLANVAFRNLQTPVLTVCHTVQTDWSYRYFFDGFLLDESTFYLGDHQFQNMDTHEILSFPVIFGTNISNADVDCRRHDLPDSFRDAYDMNLQYPEISWETLPSQDEGGIMWYTCRYQLPEACTRLTYVGFVPRKSTVTPVKMKSFSVK